MCDCHAHQDTKAKTCTCSCQVHKHLIGWTQAPLPYPEAQRVNQDQADHDAHLALVNEIERWWMGVAEREIEAVVPKAVEYGATDLVDIGSTLARTMGREGMSDGEKAELGIYFYLIGKMARWSDAIKENRRVSDDTLHDIGVYVRMAQRVRAVGGWPVGPLNADAVIDPPWEN